MHDPHTRHYAGVHFPAYLDNGGADPVFHPPVPPAADTAAAAPAPVAAPAADARPGFHAAMDRLCRGLLGAGVRDIDFPGGAYRNTCRLHLTDGRVVMASRRATAARARLEERVLHHLHRAGAPVPAPLAFNGLVLLQEALPGQRLSEALRDADRGTARAALSGALHSLAELHRIASRAGLDQAVPPIGAQPDWLVTLLDRPAVIGAHLGLPCPPYDTTAAWDLLYLLQPRFVKWDARPGNAMRDGSGAVRWFDWEHCGARHRLDDMVWLLCDEAVPDDCEDLEEELIATHLDAFRDGRPPEEAHEYLRLYGVLHSCVRLGRLLDAAQHGGWPQADEVLARPYPGAARAEAQRLCRRAARWARQGTIMAPLSDWFTALTERLEAL